MNKNKFLLGVDGGNTKTDYFLFTTDGQFYDAIRMGTCSHEALKDSYAGTKRVMGEHLATLFERHNISIDDIEAAAFGLAGADIASQKKELNRVISELGFKKFQLENDGILGVKAASPNGKGICSINGTGTVTVGVDDRGQFLQVGGVGYISGDEAGGSFIVRRTYQAVYDSFYRLGKKTILAKVLMDRFQIPSNELFLDYIVHAYEQKSFGSTEIIKMVFQAANDGDEVAIEILEQVGLNLARSTAGCINNLHFDSEVNVVLAGSVWSKATAPHMQNFFMNFVSQNVKPKCVFHVLNASPASGAVIWAMEIASGSYPSYEVREDIIRQVALAGEQLPKT